VCGTGVRCVQTTMELSGPVNCFANGARVPRKEESLGECKETQTDWETYLVQLRLASARYLVYLRWPSRGPDPHGGRWVAAISNGDSGVRLRALGFCKKHDPVRAERPCLSK